MLKTSVIGETAIKGEPAGTPGMPFLFGRRNLGFQTSGELSPRKIF